MKALLFLFAGALIFCSLAARAQQFSPTTGVPCENCHPTGYSTTGSPSISDNNRLGGNTKKYWYANGSLLPVPPSLYAQGLSAGAGKNSFMTLKTSEAGPNDILYLTVGGFDVNKTYTFHYSVLAAGVIDDTDPSGVKNFPFGESAKLTIMTSDQIPVLVMEQTTDFTINNQIQWLPKSLSFKPKASTLVFKFSGKTAGAVPGYINFSIDKYPFDCQLQPDQVLLMPPTIKKTMFPNDKINLSAINTFGATPAGAELVWKSGPNSSDPTLTAEQASNAPISNADPANIKPYYAFYYAKDFNCYNVPISQAQVKFLYEPKQVPLKGSYIAVSCDQPKANLTTLVDGPTDDVVWFKTNDHSGPVVYNASDVSAGDYYAFYNNGGSFSLPAGDASIAYVKVENPLMSGIPDLGPTMNINSLIFPLNGSKDFVVKIQNIKAENSNCSVFFKVSKLPGFTITYDVNAGQSNVNGGMANNNDAWVFSEADNGYITVTSKNGILANGSSYIGFKITRKPSTPAGSKQNLAITIPGSGGGGETNISNNQIITTLTAN